MQARPLTIGLLTVALASAASLACGSDDSGGGSSGAGASAGAGAAAGAAGAGGSAGAAGAGGAGAQGGSAGAGGRPIADEPCVGPEVATSSVLCLKLAPEAMDFDEQVIERDGRGVLIVEIFGGSDPETATVLATRRVPDPTQHGIEELGISELPALRIDGLPSKVYLGLRFADHPAGLSSPRLRGGLFVNGDFSRGVPRSRQLTEVTLSEGSTTTVTEPLTALRDLSVVLTRTVTPLDNGQGPATALLFDAPTVVEGMGQAGTARGECVDLSGTEPVQIKGFTVGSGSRYLIAMLDDFDTGAPGLVPGTLLSFPPSTPPITLPPSAKLEVGPRQYAVTAAVELGQLIPLQSGEPRPPSSSCP